MFPHSENYATCPTITSPTGVDCQQIVILIKKRSHFDFPKPNFFDRYVFKKHDSCTGKTSPAWFLNLIWKTRPSHTNYVY